MGDKGVWRAQLWRLPCPRDCVTDHKPVLLFHHQFPGIKSAQPVPAKQDLILAQPLLGT